MGQRHKLRRSGYLALLGAALLAAIITFGLRQPQGTPAILIDKPVPAFDVPTLNGHRLTNADMAKDRVVMVNFFASWCVPCRAEHPQLMRLAKRHGIIIYGIAWRDSAANADGFLKHLGNPYTDVGIDATGRMGRTWGVAGVPNSFILTPRGRIGFHHPGDIRADQLEDRLLPVIRALEARK